MNLSEIKNCIALLNNFIVQKEFKLNGDEAITLGRLLEEAHRICKLIDVEIEKNDTKSDEE